MSSKKLRLNVMLSEQNRDYLKGLAEEYGISLSDALRRVIDKHKDESLDLEAPGIIKNDEQTTA